MNKPRYTEALLKIIFLWLGIAFLATGLLSFFGVIKPTANSMVQVPALLGITFSSLGIAFLLVQGFLAVIVSFKNKLHQELLASGTKFCGTVEKVYLQKYTQYGKKSPYRIIYTYVYQGTVFRHESRLLWDKPDFKEQDPIEVYANDMGKSTIPL